MFGASDSVVALATSLTEVACRERYAALLAPPPAAHAPAARNGAAASARARLNAWQAQNQSTAASAAASRMVALAAAAAAPAAASAALAAAAAPDDCATAGTASGAAVAASPKPLGALLQGPDFTLDSFRDYIATPALPVLSREGLWARAESDSDDGGAPLTRDAALSALRAAAATDVDAVE